jgi:LAO/AO transport system kinase
MTYSGYYGLGIKEIWDMVEEYTAFVRANGSFEARRHSQAKYWMYESIDEQLRNRFYRTAAIAERLAVVERQVLASEISSFAAAQLMLDLYFGGDSGGEKFYLSLQEKSSK